MSKSIDAYENEKRVKSYDADMDLLHPNRHKMVDVALEILPFHFTQEIKVLELGVGTGYFALRLLQQYPSATLTGLDGSAAMIELAATRLSEFVEQNRVDFVKSSFEEMDAALPGTNLFELVFSSYSLHHLNKADKRRVIEGVVTRLAPGGWFLNADLVSHPFAEIEKSIQDVRVAGIDKRNRGKDKRFNTRELIRTFLDNLEATEGDKPLSVGEDLVIMRESGLPNATIFWKEYREVVVGGSI